MWSSERPAETSSARSSGRGSARPGDHRDDGHARTDRTWYHFVGVGGSGMSALAQYHALSGGRVTGSDRAFDQRERQSTRRLLGECGVQIYPQDGSALGPDCDAVIVSTAVEPSIPDVRKAHEMRIPLQHRSELLARYVSERKTIAVAGTSGKSTVTAMIFTILRGVGHDPSLLTGGDLVALQDAGYPGNAWCGDGETLVIEADESDGSLVRYRSWAGVLLNLRLDHKPPAELAEIFAQFRRRTRGPFLVGEDESLRDFREGSTLFGLGERCEVRAQQIVLDRQKVTFVVAGTPFALPLPGEHNVRNAVAAIAACRATGVSVAAMAAPLADYAGVARRFQTVGSARGVEVIDDFAHNPDKISAALKTARPRGRRVLAVFQPHGFGPTRFLRDALIDSLSAGLRAVDRLWMPEIYYAGGTVERSISAADICAAVRAAGVPAVFAPQRADLVPLISAEARTGDVILVMGARDPSLTDFCRDILARLQHEAPAE